MSVNLKIRNIFQFAFSLLLMAGLSSCIMDTGFDEPGEMTSATLCLSTRSSVTRADGKDELEKDPYAENEDKIGRVALFFYTDGKSTSAPFFVTELNVEKIVSADVVVKIPEKLVTGSNFPGKKAYAYALANLPEDVHIDAADGKISVGSDDPKAATLEALQKLWVGSPGFVSAPDKSDIAPETFVMRGGGEIELQEDATTGARTASGTILLERLASKIRLWAEIPDYLYIDTTTGKTIDEKASDFQAKKNDNKIEKWESVPVSGDESNVNLYLYNLTQRGRIDGYVGACIDDPEDPEDLAYANIENAAKGARKIRKIDENFQLNDADKDETYKYSHETAYYSYPNVWDGDSPSEQHRTHVVISVPWQRVEGGEREFRECYYSVPVNALTATTDNGKAEKANCLEPNCYYRIKVRIGMLGNTNRGEAIEIPASYEVVPWSTANVDVNIKDRRFLVVNQKEWVMNNTYTLEIPFATSHKTEVVACYVNYFRYNDKWGYAAYTDATDTQPSSNETSSEFKKWLAAAKSQLDTPAGQTDGRFGEGLLLLDDDPYQDALKLEAPGSRTAWHQKMLYYKKEYFYDQYLENDNFKYYMGREHPKTFQTDAIGKPSNAGSEWAEYETQYKMDAVYTCTIDHTKHVINFSHPLVQWNEHYKIVNRNSTPTQVNVVDYYVPELKEGKLKSEFSRCEIIIKIKHEDWDSSKDHLYEETIYITQYPEMYIEVSHDYANVSQENSTNYNQYVLVNGNSRRDNQYNTNTRWDWVNMGQVSGYGGSNNNPNMYIIHTSRLSDDSTFEIGDPRSLFWNNKLDDGSIPNKENVSYDRNWTGTHKLGGPAELAGKNNYNEALVSAPRIHNNSDDSPILNYYYPADETPIGQPGSKENFIAPVFRIASSFGKVTSGEKQEARRRCAVYQEAGRPAGRWRLPTKAEVEYIANLSAEGKIPVLFGNTAIPTGYGYYWCAQGPLRVSSTDNKVEYNVKDASGNSPRCVYDEWYWTQIDGGEFPVDPNSPTGARLSPVTTTFYWGDVEKDNTQELPKP